MKQSEGVTIGRIYRDALLLKGFPVRRVVLFGSVARDEAGKDSDVDIAVICEPFAASRHEENMALRRVRRDIDIRIEPFSLHPDDFQKPFFSLPNEVSREGIDV